MLFRSAPLDQRAVPRALRGETATNQEYALRRTDTNETWMGSFNFAPIRDTRGAIVGAVVIGRDVTAAKRAEADKALESARASARGEVATAVGSVASRAAQLVLGKTPDAALVKRAVDNTMNGGRS